MRALLRHRSFRLLLVGQGVSAFGDWMATIGFMALSLAITGSAVAVGVVLVLRLLPAMIAGPLATRLVARFDRRRTMLAMDLGRAVVAGLVPLVSAIWWVYLCALLLELGSVAFLPARDSSIPDLVHDEDLPLANGLVLASSYGTIPFGAAAFAASSA
ncbi:MAG TPA: MFS transporter, partial [Acidimicrobiales bacterium]|nr:MFS transporter [Acidimicrobiales bacterium]